MAIPNNPAIMVLHQEGTTKSTLLPQTSACSLFVVVNQLHPGGGRQDKQALFGTTEISPLSKPTIASRVANCNKVSSMSLSAMAATNTRNQLCNLPAESTCRGITVTLDNNNMWNEFFRCQTEMILTKQGRRMFPCCRFRISGLEPFQRYTLVMDMQPVDNYRYKWSDGRWETNGKSDPHILRSFVHPDSPATGLDWMQNPVSFYKLKLTNNPLDREGYIIVNSMHRYIPRLYIIPADKAVDVLQLEGPDVVTFSFSQTEFFAVTAYQNLSITQLKIDYNPFAKGFRDDANNSRCCKPKCTSLSQVSTSEKLESEVKSSKEATALNNLKSLLAKMNASEKVTNKDLKPVHYDGPSKVETEISSSSTKRPWPGGLSELIKGAHVKVKRISLEKIHNGTSQQLNVDSMASKDNNMDVASTCNISDNISIPVTEEEKETKKLSKNTDSSTFNNTPDLFSAPDLQCELNKTTCCTPLNEKLPTVLSEMTTLTDEKLNSKETSGCVVKPLDCGEVVKKKRAEPVPLPLLALFLQQLKSKTRPSRPKSKSANCNLPPHSDKSSHDPSVDENLSSSTASVTASLGNKLNIQPTVSPTSQTTTSSIITCTVVHTEDETVSTPMSATNDVTAATPLVPHDALQLSTSEKISPTTSAHDVKPNTCLSDTTPDTTFVSVALNDAFSDCESSSDPKSFPVTTPDLPSNEVVNSNVSTDKSTTEPAHHSCTLPCSEHVSEAVPQSPSPVLKTPSSPYISAPSSPDPFPPSMFSDRPIPPRKALDPFPPCFSLDRPRPLLEPVSLLPQMVFTRPTQPVVQGSGVLGVTSEVNCPSDPPVVSPAPCIPKELKQPLKTSRGTKCKAKQNKGKSKLSENTKVMEGPIPVPMQPNLEDVEGQLFVSFISKKALEVHLGDETKEVTLPKMTENKEGEVCDVKESIAALENALLHDLKNMKYRQVIHPVLQAVGLKLNLLDVALSIDLQYLGVCLPIPPPILLTEGSSETCSSQVNFVSRTGKTTDITKIKGWREKFSTATSPSVPGGTVSLDTGQKNLSAFCSDMLDEYLESEGKLIDERAASFSQAVVTPVAYQLPTKSTSYVRTLDSVLKKQAVPLAASPSKPSAKYKKPALTSKNKKSVKSIVSNTNKKSNRNSSKKSMTSRTSKSLSSEPSATTGLSESKKSSRIKTKKRSKPYQCSSQTTEKPVKDSVSVATEGQYSSSTPGSNLPVGRSSGLPKTLVKLRDVEDGAVWEGKNRTYITMERAAIALSCLVTAEGIIGGSSSTVIKRRAPPCLNDFCRLGCVCASLVQERLQHHCGKPECMLRCDCLRRKVVLLKKGETDKGPAPVNHAEDDGTKVRKRKKRISYILSGPDAAPEPVFHVKTLWLKKDDSDSEQLYVPYSASSLHTETASVDLQKDLENFLHHSPEQPAIGKGLRMVKNQESLDCARVRPFSGRKLSPCRHRRMKEGHSNLNSQDSLQEMEEGELRPPTQSGPTKRLEIVSKCKWATEGSRNVVLRTVCERMTQDRLKHPFWVGKYQIQPMTKTVKDTDEGSITTYKVMVSQPHVQGTEEEKSEERIKQLEAQLIKTIGKSEVKGLPLLSQVTPAGLLKAEKKPSGALGQIMVNGKIYPHAKLELGQMGALHPANRLAAYITGRVCVANKHEAKTVTTATKTSHITSTTPTSVATTTITSTISSALDKPSEVNNRMGTEFVQVEISHANSQKQKTSSTSALPMPGTVQNLTIPSSSMFSGHTGISVYPKMPPKANIAPIASSASTTSVVKALPGPGTAGSEKTFVLSTAPVNVAHSGSGIRLMQPLSPPRPAVTGQRMVVIKPANSTGQFIHLVPLGQFKALNPNILIRHQQSTIIRLPTTKPVSQSKLQTSTTADFNTAPPPATQAQNVPVLSTVTNTVNTSTSSSVATTPITPPSGTKTLLICNKPNTVKIIPSFIGDTATSTIRILPRSVLEESKIVIDPRISSSTSSARSTSEAHPANQGLQLTSHSCLTPENQDHPKLDNYIHTSPAPTEESNADDSQYAKMSPKNVIFTDHSYTFERKKTSTPSAKPLDVFKDGSAHANGSIYHMLLNEVLDWGLVEEVECTSDAVLGAESGGESKAGSRLVEQEDMSDCTELTEDSDMYNDTDFSESSGDEDLCVTDSDERKNREKQDSNVAEVQFLTEKDDDELVDIETFEEGAEKSSVPHKQMKHDCSLQIGETGNMFKLKKRKDEKKRRVTLRNCFQNLQQALKMENSKVSKITVLSMALEEIRSLSKRRDRLVKMRDRLSRRRENYIELASQLSGKTKASISQKLDEIIAKQKYLELKDKANDTSPHHEKSASKHSKQNVKAKHEKINTNGKAEHLSTSKQKHLRLQNRRTENVCTNPTAKQNHSGRTHNSRLTSTSQLRKHPTPIPVHHKRLRPTIFCRSRSQILTEDKVLTPEVIPVVEEVVPSSQIITISNPLQPIDLTSLRERQSTTPGVAAVSISLPPVSHPLCVENPLPKSQPQVLELSSSPVNKPVNLVSLPKISSASLVQSEKLLITPPLPHSACHSSDGETRQNCSSEEAVLVGVEEHLDKEFMPKISELDAKVDVEEHQKEEDKKNAPQSKQDDDHLMSLLDELVFLNQVSEPQAAPSLTETEDVLTELLTNKDPDMDRDDERSLSPLFLKLDEDIIPSPTSKEEEEMDDVPPKVDDLVKVIFGSESPSNSSESEMAAATSDDSTHISVYHVQHDAPTPPPLMQMKTGGCTTAESPKEQASLSWRPMPKLAPLGLKTQETGHAKLISHHAPKSDSNLSSLHNTYV